MNPIYWVLIASLLVWGGIFFYMMSVDGRVRSLEQKRGNTGKAGEGER